MSFDPKKETADSIVCPHCKHIHGNYDDYLEVGDMGGNFGMDCEKCEEPFYVEFYSIFYFKTEKPEK